MKTLNLEKKLKISRLICLLLIGALCVSVITGFIPERAHTGNQTIDTMTADQLADALIRALDDRSAYKTNSEQLQEQVDELPTATNEKVQYEEVSINPNPIFEIGKSDGTLGIINNKHNDYPQQVEIYVDDTNQLIYKDMVEVGQNVETDTLLVELPPGTYQCTAYFRAINPETGEGVRKESTDITITIEA